MIKLDKSWENKSITICISGFLSAKDDFVDDWKAVLNQTNSTVYGYQWPALDSSGLFKDYFNNAIGFKLWKIYEATFEDTLKFNAVREIAW